MNNRYFQRGSGVYTCGSCNRRTRGDGESNGCEMCGQCYEIAGWDNHFNDKGETPDAEEMATFNKLLAKIVELGGDGDRVQSLNNYIFTEEN